MNAYVGTTVEAANLAYVRCELAGSLKEIQGLKDVRNGEGKARGPLVLGLQSSPLDL